MTDRAHSCTDHGHVWLETDGTPYARHRGRTQASVAVICQYCLLERDLPGFAQHTAPPQKTPPAVAIEGGDLKATLQKRLNIGSVPKQP